MKNIVQSRIVRVSQKRQSADGTGSCPSDEDRKKVAVYFSHPAVCRSAFAMGKHLALQ